MGGRRRRSRKQSAASSNSTARLESYAFFIDECVAHTHVGPVLVAQGHTVYTQAHTFGTGTLDVDWLPEVGSRRWVLITKDKNIRKRPLELKALMESRVRAFVLTSGGLSGSDQGRIFGEALKAMTRLLRKHQGPFIARVTAESSVALITK